MFNSQTTTNYPPPATETGREDRRQQRAQAIEDSRQQRAQAIEDSRQQNRHQRHSHSLVSKRISPGSGERRAGNRQQRIQTVDSKEQKAISRERQAAKEAAENRERRVGKGS
jgi:hypothetical protein